MEALLAKAMEELDVVITSLEQRLAVLPATLHPRVRDIIFKLSLTTTGLNQKAVLYERDYVICSSLMKGITYSNATLKVPTDGQLGHT